VIPPSAPQQPPARRRFTWSAALSFAALVCLGSLAGCREEEEIQVYEVPKVADRGIQTVLPGAPGRSIGVLLPTEDETWVLKVAGPTVFVSKHAAAIRRFVESIGLEGGEPKYELPAGWREENGGGPPGGPPRHKTITIDSGSIPRVELAISKMAAGQDVAANVQRWRGQLKMKTVSDEEAIEDVQPLVMAAGRALWVDLQGIYSPQAMGPSASGPMAGDMPGRPAGGELPPDHPPIPMPNVHQGAAPVLSRTAPVGSPVKYEAPAEWTPISPVMFAIASFELVEGDKQVVISISKAGGDLLLNVNRWRSDQLGLPKIDAGGLETDVTKMPIGDRRGDYLELSGQLKGKPTAIYVGMVPANADPANDIPGKVETWFVKLSGDVDLATAQRATFVKFLSTLRFER